MYFSLLIVGVKDNCDFVSSKNMGLLASFVVTKKKKKKKILTI